MLLAAVQSSEARRWGVGVSWLLLAPTTPSAIGVRTGVPNGNAMRVGLHKVCAAGARRQVQCHARAGAGHNGKPSFPMNSVPQRKRPRSYWNWPTSDLPRASLFESGSYFLLGPVGTLPTVSFSKERFLVGFQKSLSRLRRYHQDSTYNPRVGRRGGRLPAQDAPAERTRREGHLQRGGPGTRANLPASAGGGLAPTDRPLHHPRPGIYNAV